MVRVSVSVSVMGGCGASMYVRVCWGVCGVRLWRVCSVLVFVSSLDTFTDVRWMFLTFLHLVTELVRSLIRFRRNGVGGVRDVCVCVYVCVCVCARAAFCIRVCMYMCAQAGGKVTG